MPAQTRDRERGCLIHKGGSDSAGTLDACRIYGEHVGQALENLSLWDRATTDGLTRLHNRSFGAQRLQEIRSLDMRQGRPTSVLLIDLDKFKLVNDRFGHAVGDLTLKAVAAAVLAVGRKSDVVARWGGEELLMILPETSTGQALLAAERVRSGVEALSIDVPGGPVRPTVSIGAATAASCDKSPVDTLVDIADRGMYAAKPGPDTRRGRCATSPRRSPSTTARSPSC